MNERIREVMNQAMESTGVEGMGGCYMELNPEKFAELIVKECADFITERATIETLLGKLLKQHFGVK
jgi:hypothetical protein